MRLTGAFVVMMMTQGAVMADTSEQAFDKVFEAAANADGKQALGAGFVRLGGVPVVRTAGPMHRGATQPVAPDAAWHIGSITKSFTATLILQLVEQGALSLDAPIGPVLGELAQGMLPDWQALTLRQLLSHTAGVVPNVGQRAMWAKGATGLSIAQAQWVKPLPGIVGRYEYSNVGYVLAGVLAERVTGETWADLVQDLIARPLGLTSLGLGAPRGPGDAWGHERVFGFTRALDPAGDGVIDNPAWMAAAGTLHMSLADLLT